MRYFLFFLFLDFPFFLFSPTKYLQCVYFTFIAHLILDWPYLRYSTTHGIGYHIGQLGSRRILVEDYGP